MTFNYRDDAYYEYVPYNIIDTNDILFLGVFRITHYGGARL